MHGLSTTSQRPSEVPPHGPFLICFGHVCGHTYSVQLSTQFPHASHPNTGRLIAYSTFSSAWESAGDRSIARKSDVRTRRNQVSRETGKTRASQSSTRPTVASRLRSRREGASLLSRGPEAALPGAPPTSLRPP